MSDAKPKILQRRVIKLGGSLLDWPLLVPRFRHWLSEQSPATNLLVAGGGRLADEIRAADQVHRLTPDAAHWLAIRAMTLQAHLLAAMLPEAVWIERLSCLDEIPGPSELVLVDPYEAMRDAESTTQHRPLPRSWEVTSDSLSAWLAHVWEAAELVLLKSSSLDADADLAQAAAGGYVDRCIPQVAGQELPVRWVNLRDDGTGHSAAGL